MYTYHTYVSHKRTYKEDTPQIASVRQALTTTFSATYGEERGLLTSSDASKSPGRWRARGSVPLGFRVRLLLAVILLLLDNAGVLVRRCCGPWLLIVARSLIMLVCLIGVKHFEFD